MGGIEDHYCLQYDKQLMMHITNSMRSVWWEGATSFVACPLTLYLCHSHSMCWNNSSAKPSTLSEVSSMIVCMSAASSQQSHIFTFNQFLSFLLLFYYLFTFSFKAISVNRLKSFHTFNLWEVTNIAVTIISSLSTAVFQLILVFSHLELWMVLSSLHILHAWGGCCWVCRSSLQQFWTSDVSMVGTTHLEQ